MEPHVSVARRTSSEERCAFCHDTLGDEWDACNGCDTRLHPECRAVVVECPTLGCRMNGLRARWSAPHMRPRTGFRRALASMAERRASARLAAAAGVDEEPEPPRGWPPILLLTHAVLSPFALGAFALYFLVVYVPSHWAARALRMPSLATRVRERVREPGSVFTFEAALAPVMVLAVFAFAATISGGFEGKVPLLVANIALGGLLLLPPSASWFGAE